jgi:hypothetical protein
MLVHQLAAIHFSADLTPVIFGFYMVQQQQMGKWENLIRNKKKCLSFLERNYSSIIT